VTVYLELDDLLAAADAAVGRRPEIRDVGLLESALARPRSSVFGADAYPSLEEKAAALLHSLVRNHALVDGNERLGWVAFRLFLRLNGHDVAAAHDDSFAFVMAIAEGSLDDVAGIAVWVRGHLVEGLS